MNERDIRPTLTATPNEPMPVNESNTIRIDAKCNCGSDEFAWKVSDPSVSLYRQPISALLTGKPASTRLRQRMLKDTRRMSKSNILM